MVLGIALPAFLGVAKPASAKPRLWVEDVVLGERFGSGDRCFSAGSTLSIAGRGFTAGARVRVGRRTVRAGRDGGFGFLSRVPEPRGGQQQLVLRATQRSGAGGRRTATLRYWASLQGVDVPGWTMGESDARGTPGRVERARAGGFDWAIGRTLYVHYFLAGRRVFAAPVAKLEGPCGAADFRLVQFPFRRVADGVYHVHFSDRRTAGPDSPGGGYRAVRVGPAPPPLPVSTTPLFTIGGNGTAAPPGNGVAATASGLSPEARVSARPDGGLLVTGPGRVSVIDTAGRISTVAGTGHAGSGGDGGPATAAQVDPSAVAALSDGGLLIGHCDTFETGRVRRVAADGTITTIAGTGRGGPKRDGGPATAASLSCPTAVAPAPDGGVLIAEDNRIRRVSPDGAIGTIAGNGEFPTEPVDGGPARSTPIDPTDLVALPDGSALIADATCHVFRLAGGRLTVVAGDGSVGRRRDDGALAVNAAVCADAVAPAPDGGFYVVDAGSSGGTGSEPRLRLIVPDGRITTIAGTGRFSPEPTRHDDFRGDGGPARRADLQRLHDVTVLPDGGVVFTEGLGKFATATGRGRPGLARYLPPPAGGRLAVAVRRDRDRVFAPSAPAFVTVSLTAPADVTVTVRDGTRTLATQRSEGLPSGDTRIALPALARTPLIVQVSAVDAAGRVAEDRAPVLPRGWLSDALARSVAEGVIFTLTHAPAASAYGPGRCRRFGPARVDCELAPEGRCKVVASIRLGGDDRLRLATYRCPVGLDKPLVEPLRRLRPRDYVCEVTDRSCPPPIFGVVADRWLVPWG